MLWQLTINGLAAGALYTLIALGFALTYNVTKFFNFAHGALFTIGAYSALAFSKYLLVPLPLSIVFAVGMAGLLGGILYYSLYRLLRKRGASDLILLLASLGIYVVLQNVISLIFGDEITSLSQGESRQSYEFAGAIIDSAQLATIVTAAVVILAAAMFLKQTKIGKAIRAISSSEELASMCGIEVDRIILFAFIIGSGLAGLAGVLNAQDVDLTPTMGLTPLMMGIVAVIIGGQRSIAGITLGALFVGVAQHVGVWKISSQWQDAIAFLLFVIFLLYRPDGFSERKSDKKSV